MEEPKLSYYQRNKERVKEYMKKYYKEKKEILKPKRKIWYEGYYQKRKDAGLPLQRVHDPDYFKKYYQANKDKYKYKPRNKKKEIQEPKPIITKEDNTINGQDYTEHLSLFDHPLI